MTQDITGVFREVAVFKFKVMREKCRKICKFYPDDEQHGLQKDQRTLKSPVYFREINSLYRDYVLL